MRRLLLLLSAALLFAAGCRKPADNSPPEADDRAAALLPPPVEPTWELFTSAEGRFRVLLPAVPRQELKQITTPFGLIPSVHFAVDLPDRRLGIRYEDFDTPETAGTPLEKVIAQRRGLLTQQPGRRILRERSVGLQGNQGQEAAVEFSASGASRVGLIRWFGVDRRLYTLFIAARSGTPPAEDVGRFFDSFALLNAPPAAPRGPAVPPPPDSWVLFGDDAGRFSVQVPQAMKRATRPLETPAGPVTETAFETGRGSVSYRVAYADCDTPQTAQALAARAGNAAAQALGGRQVQSRAVRLGAEPGVEAVLDLPDGGRATCRSFAVGRRLYNLAVVGEGSAPPAADAARFLDSFRLEE
jgi:hypothetical protein